MSANPTTPARTISKENYLSKDFLKKENAKIWPKVWQVACREEEIKSVGDYLTYDIGDESVMVVKTAKGLKAFHNVCPHRGRALVDGCGHTNNFRCNYHGWTFSLEGNPLAVQDRQDFCDMFTNDDIKLLPVKLDTWGGFVFINFDDNCEPLAEYLKPVPEYLDPFELENMRYRWYVTTVMPANWKVALEAFMEGYHVAATHPQMMSTYGDDYTQSYAHGKHAHFGYWKMSTPTGTPSPRLKMEAPADSRDGVIEFFRMMEADLAAIFTDRDYAAVKNGLKAAVPADADPMTAIGTAIELGRQAAIADGAGYPPGLTYEAFGKTGADWHIFPNCVVLPYFDGALWYRSRPNGDDPDTCIYDIWSLKRYAPGTEPPLERKNIDVQKGDKVCLILDQDIANMKRVQRGMKSCAFKFARPNPVQEVEIINFHRVIEEMIDKP